jgi:molecular chaperone DnaJ
MPKDYYKILGVSKNASDEEVKKAYRKLAHVHHPDKPSGNEQKFKEINEAYQVLSDKNKRASYDQFGTAEPFPGAAGGQGQPGDFGGWDFSGGSPFGNGQFYSEVGDLGDIFETFFEGMGMKPRRKTYQKGSDMEVAIEITLEDAFHGLTREFSIKTHVICEACDGRGADKKSVMKTCAVCAGQGEIREAKKTFFGQFSQVKTCEACSGTGEVPDKICPVCRGAGRVNGERKITVKILPGVQNDQIIKISAMGEAGEKGSGVGDLYVHIRVKPHNVFSRNGDDLVVRLELKVVELLLGRALEVPTVEGGKKSFEIPAHFNLKEPYRVTNEGMPHFDRHGRGDLLVDFIIKAPKKVSGRVREALERGE